MAGGAAGRIQEKGGIGGVAAKASAQRVGRIRRAHGLARFAGGTDRATVVRASIRWLQRRFLRRHRAAGFSCYRRRLGCLQLSSPGDGVSERRTRRHHRLLRRSLPRGSLPPRLLRRLRRHPRRCPTRVAIAAGAAADAADYAIGATAPVVQARPGFTAAHASQVALWAAVSMDAKRVEERLALSAIAGSPLWPQGQPDQIRSLWMKLKSTLDVANQDWDAWTDWYEARLEGRVKEERHELAYVRIEDALWDQGPAIVNAAIKTRIEEQKSYGDLNAIEGSDIAKIDGVVSKGVAEPKPRRRRKKEPKSSPAKVTPPRTPLPPPSPATRFIVRQGIVDVVPPTAWAGREAQVATYHARARTIALSFSDKLANTDAEPKLAASVHVVVDVLGDDPSQLQPDQLRLASRTITSKARAYGHPSARGELGVESVSTLFELADVLVSLQALASQELEVHERAIRALDLTEASVAETKEGLDLVPTIPKR
jgi:hypothetical protein